MAFGFSPKHIDDLKTEGLSEKDALIIALETAKKLDWNIGFLSENVPSSIPNSHSGILLWNMVFR